MKRKMLKEEKELRQYFRDWMADNYTDQQKYYRKDVARLITALIRAVREECAMVAESFEHERCSPDLPCTCDQCAHNRRVVAKIREKNNG